MSTTRIRDDAGGNRALMPEASEHSFSHRLLEWFDLHGRKDLPWQQDPTPYRVWVSEVMLQQTQVQTVIPYFARFMLRFPAVRDLAEAPVDDVLYHWSGLGYYARARNLQRAAQAIVQDHGGEFPADPQALSALPGIGRSTAGAIASLAFGVREPILDGNVKRVLARHRGIEGYPGKSAVAKALWDVADKFTPTERIGHYTQAIMDLGATLCVRKRPLCPACPVAADCQALALGRQDQLPTRKPKKTLPQKTTTFLVIQNSDGNVLLQQRPPAGIWGGLWSFPECPHPVAAEDLARHCQDTLGLHVDDFAAMAPIAHGFSHYRLDIFPVVCRLQTTPLPNLRPNLRLEDSPTLWYNVLAPEALGLAAPVSTLLNTLAQPDLLGTPT